MRAISFKNEEINFKEPFKGLFTQGMVCHETYKNDNNEWLSPDEVFSENGKDYFEKRKKTKKIKVGPSESMSKSKKNTIDPENIINKYGADAVRFFILADSPPEKDVQWSDEGMISSYKFIQKFWLLNEQVLELNKKQSKQFNEEIEIYTNQIINKINHALEKFRYNLIIASYHEIYSYFKKIIEKNNNYQNLKENFKKILLVMMPVVPHLANECYEKLEGNIDIGWPKIQEKYLIKNTNNIVIQVNGKKRGLITIDKDMSEDEITKYIKNEKLIEKYLDKAKLIKKIYVKNRLINYIIK